MKKHVTPTNDQPNEELFTADQTQFSTEEPLYEAVSLPTKPEVEVAPTASKSLTKQQLLLIAVGVVATLLLVVALAMSMMRQPNITDQPLPLASEEPQSTDAMQQRISNLKKQITAADPSLDALPLPPVDLELRLENKSSRN